jgi:hypothetical protein
MSDKRGYHISCEDNGIYKIKSKGLLKSVKIIRNEFDPLPLKFKFIINGKEITTKYNNQNDKYLFDFPFIIDQINSHYINDDDDADEVDYYVISMFVMASSTKAIPHYGHLSLTEINHSFFTHEIDLAIKVNDVVLPKELKIEEEYYIPTFKLKEKEGKE